MPLTIGVATFDWSVLTHGGVIDTVAHLIEVTFLLPASLVAVRNIMTTRDQQGSLLNTKFTERFDLIWSQIDKCFPPAAESGHSDIPNPIEENQNPCSYRTKARLAVKFFDHISELFRAKIHRTISNDYLTVKSLVTDTRSTIVGEKGDHREELKTFLKKEWGDKLKVSHKDKSLGFVRFIDDILNEAGKSIEDIIRDFNLGYYVDKRSLWDMIFSRY